MVPGTSDSQAKVELKWMDIFRCVIDEIDHPIPPHYMGVQEALLETKGLLLFWEGHTKKLHWENADCYQSFLHF